MTSARSRSGRVRAGLALGLTTILGVGTLTVPANAEDADQPAPQPLAEGFTEHVDFEGYTVGPLSGQDGWTASSQAQVIPDPVNQNGRVAEMSGVGPISAHRALDGIEEGDTGTLFFRIRREGAINTSFGLTDRDDPSDFTHSRAYVNNQNDSVLLARDGGAFEPAGTWSNNAWQCVWIVADNEADEIAVYSQGGPYAEQTRLPEGSETTFGFRAGVDSPLDRFFWINGTPNAGRVMLDDVAIDPVAENLALPTDNPGDCQPGEEEVEPLLNPLPDPTPSTLGIEVEEFVQLPESSPTPAPSDGRLIRHNRVQHVSEVPDDSGRLAVPDMNEILYLIDEESGEYVDYLNVRDQFLDNFHNNAGLGTGLGFVAFHPEFADNGKFYTVHTEGGSALTEDTPDFPAFGSTGFHSVITEWTADDPAAETFEGSSREVMRVPFNGRVHTVQQISFNPTVEPGDADYGNLYILVGDGGNAVGNDNAQDLSTPQGTVFRVDPLGTDSTNGQYGIPEDNPFLDDEEALPEIYAYGLRDPHRISWDLEGENTMYLGHIGEWQIESVYAVEPGDNFGWSVREGPFRAENRQIYPLPENDAEFDYTYPVAAYDHQRDPGQTGDAGVALNGGFVYRGEIEALRGKYIFTDLVRGWVLATEADEMIRNEGDPEDLAEISQLKVFVDGEETTFADLVGDTRVDLRFGADAEGELYLVSKADGKVWKVTGARETEAEAPPGVLPDFASSLVALYTFDNPVEGNIAKEADQGPSGTDIDLVNGGREMRVADAAYPGAGRALQTQQVSPNTASNEDWKAGIYDADGVESLGRFADTDAVSVMGWFKPTGEMPALNTNTPDPNDRYNAIGLAGVLSGDSDGHGVRALLEVINVNGEPKVVALARRVDGGASWTYAADLPWDEILERGEWVHLTATFDYAAGEMQLFMNGEPLEGDYTSPTNPWGEGNTSDTAPAGIKIGGSYPQDTREQNPCDCRMDDLMFLDSAATAEQVAAQYALYEVPEVEPPTLPSCTPSGTVIEDVMAAENWAPRTPSKWEFPGSEIVLAEKGDDPGDGIRRPFEYAVLSEGPELASFALEAEVRLDEPVLVNNRDVILVFGWTSDTEYYYAHLSQDNTILPHNGIFKVDNADRVRIDDQWNGTIGAPPAVTDDDWHQVRLEHCADTGEIAVYLDGLDTPLMTATDTTFTSGRVGFGSFDNIGRMRDLTVTGTPAEEPVVQPSVEITGGGGEVSTDETITVTGTASPGSTGWREGKEVVYAELLNAANKKVVGRDVPVVDGAFETDFAAASLAPGDYRIKVSVRSVGHGNASDTADVTVTAAAPTDEVDLRVSVRSQCWGDEAVVAVHVVNQDGHKADIRATVPFGTKKWSGVADGAAVYQGFVSGESSIAAGTATVAGYAFYDGVGHYETYPVSYEAVDCS